MRVTGISDAGLSRYNGLQLRIQHRFTGDLRFSLAYTHSRSTDNSSSLTDVLQNAHDAHMYFGRPISIVPTCW